MKNNFWKIWLILGIGITLFYNVGTHVGLDLKGSFTIGWLVDIPIEPLSIIAVIAGVRMNLSSRNRTPGYLFAAAIACFYLGSLVSIHSKALFDEDLEFPSIADVFFLSFYPLVITALLMLDHRRNPTRSKKGAIDGIFIGVIVAILAIIFARPAPGGSRFTIIYPALDVMLLGVLLHVVVGTGKIRVARTFLLLGFMSLLIADLWVGYDILQNTYKQYGVYDTLYGMLYVFVGAAALYPEPGLGQTEPSADPENRYLWMLLGLAMLVAPIILYVEGIQVWVPWVYGMAAIEMLMFAQP